MTTTTVAAATCPAWCENPDHWTGDPAPIHYGPTFGAEDRLAVSVQIAPETATVAAEAIAFVSIDGEIVATLTPSGVRHLAEHLQAAADWFDQH